MIFKTNTSKAYQIINFFKNKNHNSLIICNDSYDSNLVFHELMCYESNYSIHLLPDNEILPFDNFSPNESITKQRLNFLANGLTKKNNIVVTSIANLFQLIQPVYFYKNFLPIASGRKYDFQELIKNLNDLGYQRVENVDSINEFSVRGGIIDVFPGYRKNPLRIDFFDDEIEEIREFDTESQLSIKKIESFSLSNGLNVPLDTKSIELFKIQWRDYFKKYDERDCKIFNSIINGKLIEGYEVYLPFFFKNKKLSNIFDIFKFGHLVYFDESLDRISKYENHILERRQDESLDICRPLPQADLLFAKKETILENIQKKGVMLSDDRDNQYDYQFSSYDEFEDYLINEFNDNKIKCLVLASAYESQINLWKENINDAEILNKINPTERGIYLIHVKNGQSFFDKDRSLFFMHKENILYEQFHGYERQNKSTLSIVSELNFNEDDLVAHDQYGVGVYKGLNLMSISTHTEECLTVEYLNKEILYIPIRQHHKLKKYLSHQNDNTKLDSLSSNRWSTKRSKIKTDVDELAVRLLDIESKRSIANSFSFKPDQEFDSNFHNTFPYELTSDQIRCLEDVYKDLSLIKPMNRVICGDTGFGKTEIAMRAANLVTYNNKQVILLCPSTILTNQHFKSFQNRFKTFPINIEKLSRQSSLKNKTTTIANFNNKKIDILIGTHALLNANINFDELGLLIIDEEHRFGTKQKEFIKSKQYGTHILYLSATPIPKTLNNIFSGLKDFSYLYTPPNERISTKTFCYQDDNQILKSAIQREVKRNGQVFFVQNDIDRFDESFSLINSILPNISIGFAHGKMNKNRINTEMEKFTNGVTQVLICTTIIEMGLDIQNANTIIVMNSQKFGLSQLHQLRGRVGRSSKQAYCYFMIPDLKLKKTQKLRLDALVKFSDLGSGYFVAQEDLEIRGAGEFLGDKQSGHIEQIGLSMYLSMLKRAIDQLQGNVINEPIDVEINFNDASYITETFMPSMTDRLKYYRLLNNACNDSEILRIKNELIDQCGKLPVEVANLIEDTIFSIQCRNNSIKKVFYSKENFINLIFTDNVDDETYNKIMKIVSNKAIEIQITSKNKINLLVTKNNPRIVFSNFLNELS